jgi:hypothetical protein
MEWRGKDAVIHSAQCPTTPMSRSQCEARTRAEQTPFKFLPTTIFLSKRGVHDLRAMDKRLGIMCAERRPSPTPS